MTATRVLSTPSFCDRSNSTAAFVVSNVDGVDAQTTSFHTDSLIMLFLLSAIVGLNSPPDAAPIAAPPNIVLLIADDLGYGETGCQGNAQIPTPAIDSIAANGVRFTNGYVTAPFCSASRAGLMTGRYQTRFGHEFNPIGAKNEDPAAGLPVSERTFADALHDAGYITGLVGKWHLGGTAAYHPQRRGFDSFFGFMHEGHYFVPPPWDGVTTWLRRRTLPGGGKGRLATGDRIFSTHMNSDEPDYDADNPILRNGQPVMESDYLTDAFTREATAFIDQNAELPFLLIVSYNAVHSPLQATHRSMEPFASIDDIQRRIFAGMLKNLDDSVGTILTRLKDHNIDDNTLVVFLSDNGGPTRELTSSNAPLRGEKGQTWEGGLRVPFLLKWPNRIDGGIVDDRIVSSLDLFPTFLNATGSAPNSEAMIRTRRALDGIDLLPLLTDRRNDPIHETLYWRIGNRAALRHQNWKLVRQPERGSRSADWKLYDLETDLSEQNNLANDRPAVVRELEARWQEVDAEMIDPVF